MQERFLQYSITTELAKKHSHSTYLAVPTNTQKAHGEPDHQVVLTVFSPSLFHHSHERGKLLLKAQRLKQLQHPHLLPILDLGIEDEQPFIVREYLPNGSLRSHLNKISPRPLNLKDILTKVSQIGDALVYAHEHNIIHSNIKPENILLGANDQAILTDFNLVAGNEAMLRNQIADEYAFCYLAPEQFAGVSDAKSDQYALGCLAYELITGRVPFATQSLSSMMGQPSNTLPEPLSGSIPDLPPSLDAAILKTLARDPDERFFDFSLFLEVIRSVLTPPPAFPLSRSANAHKQRVISHRVQSKKAENISSIIRKRVSKHLANQTPKALTDPPITSNINETAVSTSIPDINISDHLSSNLSSAQIDLVTGISLLASLDPKSAHYVMERVDDRVNQPLQVQENNESYTTKLEAMPQLNILTSEPTIDNIHLTQEKIDDSLLPKIIAEEETNVLPQKAPANFIYGYDNFGMDKTDQLQISNMDLPGSQRVGLSHRKRALGLILLLSMIVALLTYIFWPFGLVQPDTSPSSAQEITHKITSQVPTHGPDTPLKHPVVPASTNPTPQVSALATNHPTGQSLSGQSLLQTPAKESIPSPTPVPTTTTNMTIYFSSWADNSPAGASIAYPQIHKTAGGTGTYSDPITFAASQSALSPGTIIYVSFLKKYFIMEDDCGNDCDSAWNNNHSYEVSLWIGGDANSSKNALQSCENSLTPSSAQPVEVKSPSNNTVDTTPLFTDSGGCIKL